MKYFLVLLVVALLGAVCAQEDQKAENALYSTTYAAHPGYGYGYGQGLGLGLGYNTYSAVPYAYNRGYYGGGYTPYAGLGYQQGYGGLYHY